MSDTLRAGERLELDQRLVSANGRYTLFLQTDSNLVLYHDAIDVSNAYWATGTEWLPPDQRPTHLYLQGRRAHGHVRRQRSGALGVRHVGPRVR
jgi:hypothetical protein